MEPAARCQPAGTRPPTGPAPEELSWQLAAAEAARAVSSYDDVARWLDLDRPAPSTPVAAEIWVLSRDLRSVLLVRHRWRSWVPPGGKVEPGEHPREAARREVLEETGLLTDPAARPVAAAVRSFREDWSPTLALSYAAVVNETPPVGEPGQPVRWHPVASAWSTWFPEDAARVARYVALLRSGGGRGR